MRNLKKKSLVTAIIVFQFLFMVFPVSATTYVNSDKPAFDTFTYWNGIDGNNSKTSVYMKPLYQASEVFSISSITGTDMKNFSDICTDENGLIYILDSGTPQINILDKNYKLVKSINNINNNGEIIDFKGAQSLTVDSNGDIYLCGTKNECIWILDSNGNLKKTMLLPDSEIIPKEFSYSPVKVAVDTKGYVYVLSDSCYYGAILYSPKFEFLGFYGANNVSTSASQILSNIWNKFFVNDIKKDATVKSLPFSFSDLAVGNNDFIYTITGRTGSSSYTGQLKILNPAGVDVMNKSNYDFADGVNVTAGPNAWVVQDISNIAVNDKFIYLLDTGHGKIFVYDIKGNTIGAFGGGMQRGTQKGLFQGAKSIALNGNDIIVSDSEKNTLTVLKPTEYGELVLKCQDLSLDSKYTDAESGWKEVLNQDKNSQLAYRGLARSALSKKEYKSAMSMAKSAYDRETYSEAMSYYRKDFISNNFVWIVLLLVIIVLAFIFLFFYNKKKKTPIKTNNKLRNYYFTLFHPFDGFTNVKEKKQGSIIIGIILCLMFYISSIIKEVYSGFSYSYYNIQSFNSLYFFVKTIGVILLWTIVNWAVCTLFGGLGKIKEIFIVITYSITPLIVSNLLYAGLSNILIKSEIGLLNVMVTLFWIYAVFLIIAGTLKIHDFGFGTMVGTSILTILGILIIIFLLFIVILLLQQFFGFAVTIINEIIYR